MTNKQTIFKYLDNQENPSMQDVYNTFALSKRDAIDHFNEWRQLRQETPVEARPILEAWPEQPSEFDLAVLQNWLAVGLEQQRYKSILTPGVLFTGDEINCFSATFGNWIVGVKPTDEGQRVFVIDRSAHRFQPDPEIQEWVSERLKAA